MPTDVVIAFNAFVTQAVRVDAHFFNADNVEEIPGAVEGEEFPGWSSTNLDIATINTASANAGSALVTPTGVPGLATISVNWKGLMRSAVINFQEAEHQPVRVELDYSVQPLV